MNNSIITKKQVIAIMLSFLLGSSMVIGVGSQAGRDAWIAVLTGMIMALPAVFIYSRILTLFPEKGLFEVINTVFGRIIGSLIILFYVWYAFSLGALVIRNFTEFVSIISLHETPQLITAAFLSVLCIWAVKSGIEVIGRWAAIMLPIMLITIVIISLLLIPDYNIDNIRPVLYNGLRPVIDASFSVFSFPFAELVICMVIFCYIKKGNRPVSIFLWSLFSGGVVLLATSLRSALVIGDANIKMHYFASYATVRVIKIGDFLERIEVSVAILFLLGGFVKICICLLAAGKGIADIFKIRDFRQIIAPIGLMMMLFSLISFKNTMEMFHWADNVSKYYAIPFQIVLPIFIWIAAEIKAKKQS